MTRSCLCTTVSATPGSCLPDVVERLFGTDTMSPDESPSPVSAAVSSNDSGGETGTGGKGLVFDFGAHRAVLSWWVHHGEPYKPRHIAGHPTLPTPGACASDTIARSPLESPSISVSFPFDWEVTHGIHYPPYSPLGPKRRGM